MRSPVGRFLLLIPVLSAGCQDAAQEPVTPPLVSVKGKVTLDGKPLEGATIGFLPATGSAGAGDVKADGTYEVTYLGFKGLPAGDYVVQVSYKMGSNGKPQSLAQQFSLIMPKSMIGAKELLPKKYSDFGASELRAKVSPQGGVFNFDLTGPLDDPPPITADAAAADDEAPAPPAQDLDQSAKDKASPKAAPPPKPEAKPESEVKK